MYWVYKFFDERGVSLYVGVSKNPLGRRLTAHRDSSQWFGRVRKIELSNGILDRFDALAAEREAIAHYRPLYNVSQPDPDHVNGQRVAEMAKLCSDGYSTEDIGDLYGITRQRVRQILEPQRRVTRKWSGSPTIETTVYDILKAASRTGSGCTIKELCDLLPQIDPVSIGNAVHRLSQSDILGSKRLPEGVAYCPIADRPKDGRGRPRKQLNVLST